MGVRHDRHVMVQKRQVGQVFGLLERIVVEVCQPELNRFFFRTNCCNHSGLVPKIRLQGRYPDLAP